MKALKLIFSILLAIGFVGCAGSPFRMQMESQAGYVSSRYYEPPAPPRVVAIGTGSSGPWTFDSAHPENNKGTGSQGMIFIIQDSDPNVYQVEVHSRFESRTSEIPCTACHEFGRRQSGPRPYVTPAPRAEELQKMLP